MGSELISGAGHVPQTGASSVQTTSGVNAPIQGAGSAVPTDAASTYSTGSTSASAGPRGIAPHLFSALVAALQGGDAGEAVHELMANLQKLNNPQLQTVLTQSAGAPPKGVSGSAWNYLAATAKQEAANPHRNRSADAGAQGTTPDLFWKPHAVDDSIVPEKYARTSGAADGTVVPNASQTAAAAPAGGATPAKAAGGTTPDLVWKPHAVDDSIVPQKYAGTSGAAN